MDNTFKSYPYQSSLCLPKFHEFPKKKNIERAKLVKATNITNTQTGDRFNK